MKADKLSDVLFNEFSKILASHGVTGQEAHDLTIAFSARWYMFPSQVLKPIENELRQLTFTKYHEKEADIKKLFDQVFEDLRLLISQDAGASDAKLQ